MSCFFLSTCSFARAQYKAAAERHARFVSPEPQTGAMYALPGVLDSADAGGRGVKRQLKRLSRERPAPCFRLPASCKLDSELCVEVSTS